MDIFFKHFMDSNVMVIKDNNILVNDYRINMLIKNDIKNLLKLNISCINGNVELLYDISCKQSLDEYCLKHQLNYRELRLIFDGIISIYNNLRRYLLNVNHIIMETKYMFLDNNTNDIYFCYYINHHVEFQDCLKNFVRKLVMVTSHSDRQAVELIYGVLNLCETEHFLFSAIEDYIHNYAEQEQSKVLQMNTENERYGIKYLQSECEDKPNENNNVISKDIDIHGKINEKNKFIKEGVFGTLSGFFYNKSKSNADMIYESNDKTFSFVEDNGQKEGKLVNDSLLCDGNMDNGLLVNEGTCYIGDKQKSVKRVLMSLSGCNEIIINEYPFIIGKHVGKADGIIKDSSVSRLHAKIELINDKCYVIEDLNSKNGTYVNGERLNPYEKRIIEIGDRLTFSAFEYIFK